MGKIIQIMKLDIVHLIIIVSVKFTHDPPYQIPKQLKKPGPIQLTVNPSCHAAEA